MRAVLSLALLVGCSTPATIPSQPLGVQGHLAEARRHESDARALEAKAAAVDIAVASGPRYVCRDQGLADRALPGPGSSEVRAPCWSSERSSVERDRAAAARLRAAAQDHRARARRLVISERAWCAGLPPEELDHTPFDHRQDIAAVSAELDGDQVVGARIRFARVPQLTAEWLRQTLACHQALAAADGYDPTYMTPCPSVVAGAQTTVVDEPEGVVVVVRSTEPAAALTIYARAEALLDAHADHLEGLPEY